MTGSTEFFIVKYIEAIAEIVNKRKGTRTKKVLQLRSESNHLKSHSYYKPRSKEKND